MHIRIEPKCVEYLLFTLTHLWMACEIWSKIRSNNAKMVKMLLERPFQYGWHLKAFSAANLQVSMLRTEKGFKVCLYELLLLWIHSSNSHNNFQISILFCFVCGKCKNMKGWNSETFIEIYIWDIITNDKGRSVSTQIKFFFSLIIYMYFMNTTTLNIKPNENFF